MTAKEKIELSEYNLNKMKEDVQNVTFRYDLSNFLASAHGILWNLFYEYKQNNQDISNFKKWYKNELADIEKEFGLLRKRRNKDIHEGNLEDLLVGTITTEDSIMDVGGWFVSGIGTHYTIFGQSNEKNIAWCEKYLERLKKMINDSKKFS